MRASHGLATLAELTTQQPYVHVDIDTTVEPLFGEQEGTPSKPTPQLIKKFKPFSIMLFSMTLGYGWMQEKLPSPDRVPDPSTPPNDTLGTAEYNVQVFYRRNSATLEGTYLSALEVVVAVQRALFVSGGGRAFAAGHASPEGPDNDGLSQRRADNLIKVLTEALADDLAVSTGSFGYGHRAALNDGLTRPGTVDPNDKATLAQVRSEEQRLFPQYRTVMLWVNGLLLIRVQIGKGVIGAPCPSARNGYSARALR